MKNNRIEKINSILLECLSDKPTFIEYILNECSDYNNLVGRWNQEKLFDTEIKIYSFYKNYYMNNYHDRINLTIDDYFSRTS